MRVIAFRAKHPQIFAGFQPERWVQPKTCDNKQEPYPRAIALKPDQEHRVERALESGAYRNAEEVIDRALEILDAQNAWPAANRETIDGKIRRGIEQLERGQGIREDALDAYLAKLGSQSE